MKKLLEANASGGRRVSQVFSDFCELAALAVRNSVDLRDRDEREAKYLRIIGGYTSDEAYRFRDLFGELVLKLEAGFSDVLGDLYMSLDLGNERLGQFFTPYDVSLLTAKMTIGDYTKKLAGQEFITVHEPACGSGGMVIAVADALREAGVNYQQRMHVTAVDLELTAVHMAYVQLSLLHVPAVVVHGNTLTLEQHDAWHTPAHVIDGWNFRLSNRSQAHTAPVSVLPVTDPDGAKVTPIHKQLFDIEGIA